MFTGIISQTTKVENAAKVSGSLKITFKRPKQWTDLVLGESVAVNGTCLTVEELADEAFICSLMPETLAKTTFGGQVPTMVNLERSLKAGDRISGHLVQGHVDCAGEVVSVSKANDYRITIGFPAKYKNLVIEKGSIAVDGVSLTVAEVWDNSFDVALVPYTLQHTTLGQLKVGDKVNLEFDMLSKYAWRQSS